MKKMNVAILFVLLYQCALSQKTTTINIENKVGESNLILFDSVYVNQFNEPFTVNKFRYYISNIKITYANGNKVYKPKNYYHLVNEEFVETKKLVFPIKLPNITTIEFLLGVDSIKNTSGVQTGDLDPAKGMFWTWNTGYIYATLEGQSDSSKSPAHYYTYHVGGYKKGENALKKIKVEVAKNNNSKATAVTLSANVLKWFKAKTAIKISNESVCHQPCEFALRLADNYATMFSAAYQ